MTRLKDFLFDPCWWKFPYCLITRHDRIRTYQKSWLLFDGCRRCGRETKGFK